MLNKGLTKLKPDESTSSRVLSLKTIINKELLAVFPREAYSSIVQALSC